LILQLHSRLPEMQIPAPIIAGSDQNTGCTLMPFVCT
jgi:hypothetical protein